MIPRVTLGGNGRKNKPCLLGSSPGEKLLKERKAVLIVSSRLHISTGDLLRHSPDPDLQSILHSGQLAPSSAVQRALQEALEEVPEGLVVVIDGFPRLVGEAEWLDRLLLELGRDLSRVLVLEIDLAESEQRLAMRGRPDDSPESTAQKWDEYRQNTRPVVDLYRRRGQSVSIDGSGTMEQVAARVSAALKPLFD